MSKLTNEQLIEKFSNMKPMKYSEPAHDHPKAQEMINNVGEQFFAMMKYDGEWCRAIIHEDGVMLQSRSVSRVTGTYGDKTDLVPQITAELKENWPVGTVLLGELAFDDYTSTSREAGSVLRCKAPKAIERQKDKKIHFFVFDALAYDGEDLMDKPFAERFVAYPEFHVGEYVKVALNDSGAESDFMGMADHIWKQGGEGIMIVRKDMMYMPGSRRAWQSAKLKKKLGVLEAKVVDFIKPNRLYEGDNIDNWKYFVDEDDNPADPTKMIDYGSLTPVTKPYYYGWINGVVVEYEGRTVRVTSGLTDAERAWFAGEEAQEKLKDGGLIVEITGMELTEDSIRHPIFLQIKE